MLIIVCFTSIPVQAQDNVIKNMNFKGTDIRDVLRGIAEAAEVNLVTDSSVKGNVTIHLRNITFEKALDLITKSHGLAYTWDENTVVVATPERISSIYKKIVTRTISLEDGELSRIKNIVAGIYPGLNIQVDKVNGQLIIMGEKKTIDKARNLIDEIKSPAKRFEQGEKEKNVDGEKVESKTQLVTVNYIEPVDLIKNIKNIYPELKVSNNNNRIIVSGPENMVRDTLTLIEKLDISEANETDVKEDSGKESLNYKEIVNIKFGSLETIKKEINKINQSLEIKINELERQLVIKGKKEDVLEAATLARKWSKSQEKITRIVKIDFTDLSNMKEIVSKLHPDVKLQLNKAAHKLILNGKRDEVSQVISLVNKLDVSRRQVIIEARVEEINKSSLSEMGIDYQENGPIRIVTKSEVKEETNPEDEYKFDSLKMEWPDYLDILEQKGKAKTLANPHLMTLNGEKGKLLIGDRIPVKMENDDDETTSIKYIEAGINLEFTPWITEENSIELKVAPSVSSIGEERYEGYPQIQTREVETTLRLQDGETFSIGGLIKESVSENISKVPYLSEIPVLGELFKHRGTDKSRTELLIFITPRIVKEDKKTKKAETEEKEETQSTEIIETTKKAEKNIKQPEIKSKSKKNKFVNLSEEELREILGHPEKKSNMPKIMIFLQV